MSEVPIEGAKQAIRDLHSCESEYRSTTRVVQDFGDQGVWEGDVYTFDLIGHPSAVCCYAWSSPVEGSEIRRFVAVLQKSTVNSPEAAVSAAVEKEYKARGH
jgi:hypothetical protein